MMPPLVRNGSKPSRAMQGAPSEVVRIEDWRLVDPFGPGLVCEMLVPGFGPAPQLDGPAQDPAMFRAPIFLDHQVDARNAFASVRSIDRRHAVAHCRAPLATLSLMAHRASVSAHERHRPLR
jgi:hypothetical protein